MPILHDLPPWLAPAASIVALVWSVAVHAAPPGARRRTLREEDLSAWLLADIGWRDGRDTTARRMGQRCNRPRRPIA